MADIKQYVIGSGEIPGWLKAQSQKGRFKLLRDEDMNVIGGTIHSPCGQVIVSLGDTIVLTKSGLAVKARKEKVYVKKEKAEYKGVQ